jgi:outer membrane lipoprotein LolB
MKAAGLVIALLFISISACKTLPERISTAGSAVSAAQRTAALQGCADFQVSGKLAISQTTGHGSDGGSGRFQWQQKGEVIDFRLSAPLSNQTWQLQGLPGSFELTDSKGQVRQNASAEQLIFDASGWTLPVTQLRTWVLGLPSSATAETMLSRYPDGTLKQFNELGWQVNYQSYTLAEPRLPIKIKAQLMEAANELASVKIIVRNWQGCSVD